MAVFGIPVSHEDDALRAVRAAAEMREAIAEHGLEARIGVNTGEVVVGGEGETLVTGDAVNVAARLEQAAPSGEVLIGGETRLLVRDAVRIESVEPLALKGKSEPVAAFRLLEVIGDAAPLARHLATPLVGRERERQRLWRDFEDAVADRTCRLFTLLGPAGIGKSRLVADFLEHVGDSADILRGRCLSYGEGITYWPLVEILVSLGVEADSVIGTSPPETQLAFRRLLEARAIGRPQVVVIDDLQWAEPVFVDLVEHVADLSRDAPIFLLCVARTELLDARPDWGGGKINATSLLLEPLGPDECAELMERLGAQLDDELLERITSASAGNPLYVEEMLAMVREHGGDGEIVVPPTIQALLQARIDSLDSDVRVVMERGSVEGEVFHRGAVAVLSPDLVRAEVGSHLTTLVRKELIRSTAPTFPDDEGFRFRHLLIRDAAYESLPKAVRAELHERFAEWLSTQQLVEIDEIVGYHLEQAHRYRSELDPADPTLARLAGHASGRLRASGRSALARGDHAAGRMLLGRAMSVLPSTDPRRGTLAPELALALWEAGELGPALQVLESNVASDPVDRAFATVVAYPVEALTLGPSNVVGAASRLEEARGVLEAAAHDEGLGVYWRCIAVTHWDALNATETIRALERGLEHVRRADSYSLTSDLVTWIRAAYGHGPTPVDEALRRSAALDELIGASSLGEADSAMQRARLIAMRGDLNEARGLLRTAREAFLAAGMTLNAAISLHILGFVEHRAGDVAAREETLRANLAELQQLDAVAYEVTSTVFLAECLYEQGRYDEARELSHVVRHRTAPGDLVNFVYVDGIDACLLARTGRTTEALPLAERAVELTDATDFYSTRYVARTLAAEAHHLSGQSEVAERLAREAVDIAVAKGDVMAAQRAQERLGALGIDVV